jgi:RNA-directed DNA polymerase
VSFAARCAEPLMQGATRWRAPPRTTMPDSLLLRILADSFLAGEPTVPHIIARASRALGKEWRWLRPLAERYIKVTAGRTRPRRRDVVEFLLHDAGFERARSKYSHQLRVAHRVAWPKQMQPVPVAQQWNVPVIESAGALADWLGVTPSELLWFADLKGLADNSSPCQLLHYHYRVLPKQYGNVRLIEAPKPRLKTLQQKVLAEILDKIPPHSAVHGFVKGRSIKTFVAPHVGRHIVLRMDLQDFFPSFTAARIQALFRTIGYPESVADLLGGICTNAVPASFWRMPALDIDSARLRKARILYSKPHLPQGAPTSPALANVCTYRLDCRLTGLAKSVGAEYTRYADDLAFSGDQGFERKIERFSTHIAALLIQEGFSVNFRKTRVMRQGVRQRLAGIVVNRCANVMRPDFDRLKAMLTNCVRLGPASQNREAHPQFRAHLEGQVGFVEMVNPAKGKRLRVIFEKIRWE